MNEQTTKGFFWKLRSFLKENRSFLPLLLIPLALGILLFAVTRATIDREVSRYGQLQTEYFAGAVDKVMDEAERIADAIAGDSVLRQALKKPELTRADLMALSDAIRSRKEVSDTIDSIYLILPDGDCIVDDRGVYTYSSGEALFSSADPALHIDPTSTAPGWNVVNRDLAPPFYVRQLSAPEGNQSAATLVLILNKSEFLQLLLEVKAEFCCLYNDQCDICTLPLAHSAVDWSSSAEVSRLLGKEVHCTYRGGERFTYLVAVSTKEYNRPLRMLLLAFGIYYLAILTLGAVRLRRIARERRERISDLVEALPSPAAPDASYEELLGGIRAALERYQLRAKSGEELLRERNMRYLLNGHEGSTYDLLAASGIRKAREYYVATFFLRDVGAIWEADATEEHAEMLDIIFHSAFRQFAEDTLGIASVDMYPHYAAVFSAF